MTKDRNEEYGVLELTSCDDQGTDYILDPEAASCWIEVDNISVYVVRERGGEGVSVYLYPRRCEADEELAECRADYSAAEERINANPDATA